MMRVREAMRVSDLPDAPWMVGFLDRVLAGADLDEAIGIQTAPDDRKEPHSIEDVVARLERVAERLVHLADQRPRPGVPVPLLALAQNEMTSRDAAKEIGVDQQTVRNWCHRNPNLGCFRDGRWIVLRDQLEIYKRARFPDATNQKLSR